MERINAPIAREKFRQKNVQLAARIRAGEITTDEARTELKRFVELQRAHAYDQHDAAIENRT